MDTGTGASSDTDTASPTDTATGPVVVAPGRSGSTLTLADFFNPDDSWSEGSFDVADHKAVSGIADDISGCGDYYAKELELRLEDNYKRLDFSVGQTNGSKTSDQVLTVAVLANGRQIAVQNVPFNKIQSFSVPVTAVNSLKIDFYVQDNGNCQGSVTALIFKPVIN
jgi:hypothetical protein